jgi:hypothetical protein
MTLGCNKCTTRCPTTGPDCLTGGVDYEHYRLIQSNLAELPRVTG